jgi:uncharacterized SAM-binding protein YcdF (DUF218 family)
MTALLSVLKQSARLESVTFWCLAALLGVCLAAWPRTRSWALRYFIAIAAALWLVSTPIVATGLVSLVDGGYRPLERAADARGAETIVVLGGGAVTFHFGGLRLNTPSISTAFRVVEAARVYGLIGHPQIVLTGGVAIPTSSATGPESEAMRDAILRLGIPADHLVLESSSRNTREEALAVRRLLEGRERQPFVLVTSSTHMPRSMAAFRAVGLNPIASPAPFFSEGGLGIWRWLPNDVGLMVSDAVVYDAAARVYYWSRGW